MANWKLQFLLLLLFSGLYGQHNSSLKYLNDLTVLNLSFDAEVGEKLEKGLLSKTMLLFFLS
jgi:hypothetical protein